MSKDSGGNLKCFPLLRVRVFSTVRAPLFQIIQPMYVRELKKFSGGSIPKDALVSGFQVQGFGLFFVSACSLQFVVQLSDTKSAPLNLGEMAHKKSENPLDSST